MLGGSRNWCWSWRARCARQEADPLRIAAHKPNTPMSPELQTDLAAATLWAYERLRQHAVHRHSFSPMTLYFACVPGMLVLLQRALTQRVIPAQQGRYAHV